MTALDALFDIGRPRAVQLAILIDRGGRELPIAPDFVAKKVATATNEEIAVMVKEIDDKEGVALVELIA